MGYSCTVCKKELTKYRGAGLQCSGPCQLFYHQKCASITPEEFDIFQKGKFSFMCVNCKKTQKKAIIVRRTATPTREPSNSNETCDNNDTELTEEKVDDDTNFINSDLEALKAAQNEIKKSVQILTDLVTDVNAKVNMCNTILDSVNQLSIKVDQIERRLILEDNKLNVIEKKKPTLSEIIKNKNPVFIAKPKDKSQKNEQTTSEIQKAIDPSTSKVTNFRQVSTGAVFISCIDQSSVDKCMEDARNKLGDRYDINIPKKKTAQIKIVGLSDDVVTEEEIFERIKSQNDIIDEESKINLVHVKKTKRGSNIAIIEADENTHNKIVTKGKLNIGWRRCAAFEFINVPRCFKCQRFNHIAKYCDKNSCCGVCSEDHETNKCENKTTEACVNCIDAKQKYKEDFDVHHCAWDPECSVFKRTIEIEKKKLRFYN